MTLLESLSDWFRAKRIAYYAARANAAIDNCDPDAAFEFWLRMSREQARQAAVDHFRKARRTGGEIKL